MFWIIFGAVWGAFAIIGLLLLAAVPGGPTSNADALKLAGWCGVIAFVICTMGNGVLSLLGVV